MSEITKLPDGSAFFTADVMSKEEAMKLPVNKRPICYRISSEMYHAVFEAIGEASMQWKPRPSGVFDSEGASKVAVDLCFKIAAELEKEGGMRITGNRVRIIRLPMANQSPGGVHYPMQFRDDEKIWVVCEVGPGRVTKKGILIAPEISFRDRVVVSFDLGFKELPDGSRIVDARQLLMKW